VRLEVRDLRLVVAVAELGTLTRAGQQLHLTQSALSHQLADLEARLGTPLFQRIGRRMVPTIAGERLARRGHETLEQLRDVERELADTIAEREGLLRLATECYTCYHWLPGVLRAYREQHPRVEVRIVAEATARPVRALLAGTLDLCLVSCEVHDRRIATTKLFDDEMVLLVHPEHPLAGRTWVAPADLQEERLLCYSAPEDNTTFQRVLAPAGVSARRISRIQLTEAIIEMAKAGFGAAILTRWAAEPAVQAGTLCPVRITQTGVHREWRAATRAAKVIPPHVTEFTRFLRAAIRSPSLGLSVDPVRRTVRG
jgi:LysR family transcriptional regulator for metE and metH